MVRDDYDLPQGIIWRFLDCLKKGGDDENQTEISNMTDWKLIPFAQNTLSRDQMTELMQKQNQYLHEVHVVSIINVCPLKGLVRQDYGGEDSRVKRKT